MADSLEKLVALFRKVLSSYSPNHFFYILLVIFNVIIPLGYSSAIILNLNSFIFKMTRLQRRNSSCNCGKTTKESNSFVTKNKTYETRSGVQRKQEGSNGCQKNLPVNTLNLRGKVYLKKMDGPVVSLPIRNGQKMNGTTTIPVIKSSIAKICKKKCVKNDKNGDTKELIDGSLKEIISAKLQVEFIDIETNLKKEDTAISNEILTTKELLVKSLTTNQDKIKNGVFLEINGDTPCEKELIVEKIKNDIVSNEDEPFKNGEVINGFQNIDDKQNDVSFEQTTKKKRKTVKRRTAFELFIKDSCENIGKSVLKDKRARRVPCSFSPESPRKLKETLNPDEQTLIKVEDNQHSDELTLIKVEDIQCSQPVLTKKGLPFKKKGRKPKPKGPIEHYLDVYVKNKEKSCLSKDSSLVIESDIGSNKNNQLDEAKLGIENNESSNETPKQNKVYKNIILPICNATPFRNRHPDLKRKKHEKKSSLKKQKTVDKLNTEEFSSPIIFILGYRINRGQKEMLVQFENGTSNWINYSKHEFDVAKIKEFYEHSDQALSTVNRLGYKTFFPTISVSSLNSDDSDLSSGDESDSNEVFFRSPSLSDSFGINLLQLTDKMPIDVCNIKADALEPDLSNLCNFVMSSKHVKLYPSEKNQEFMVKHDGVFVNIFLKGCLLKDQKKNDSLNQMSCEKLITTLEDCAVDSDCGVAVIYGIEDFFASNSIFEKLLKKTSALEGKKYEGDISMLRYIF